MKVTVEIPDGDFCYDCFDTKSPCKYLVFEEGRVLCTLYKCYQEYNNICGIVVNKFGICKEINNVEKEIKE